MFVIASRVLSRSLVVLIAVVCLAGAARAAGEWEWTDGQGWTQGAGVARPTAKEQLAYAYQLEQRGEYMDSARQYFLLIRNFPDTEEAGVGLQRLAKCLFEMENYYTSYQAIEQVIKTYPKTGRMSDLVEIELRIAKKMISSKAPGSLFGDEKNAHAANIKQALEVVDAVIEHDPYGPVAAEAYLVKGEGNLYINEIATARTAFETIRDEFPRSDFVERARLGILYCDQLLGQANPREVREQEQLVRDQEKERTAKYGAPEDDFDNIDKSVGQLNEVEAGKMMEQAAVYHKMGTHNAVKSSEFLYKEVVRRYPQTPQADEAREKLGVLKVPKEKGRLASSFERINLNPFSVKEKEPPWIVPQLPAEAVVLDEYAGPVAGVPELEVAGGVGLTPAALSGRPAAQAVEAPYSPMPASPSGDGMLGPPVVYRSEPSAGPPPVPMSVDPQPSRPGPLSAMGPNPVPTISDSDLVATGNGPGNYAPQQYGPPLTVQQNTPYPAPQPQMSAPIPDMQPQPYVPNSPPTLGPLPEAPMGDLIGPAPRVDPGQTQYQYQSQQQVPVSDDYFSAPDPSVSQPYMDSPPLPDAPMGRVYQQPNQGGGWTLGDDFR